LTVRATGSDAIRARDGLMTPASLTLQSRRFPVAGDIGSLVFGILVFLSSLISLRLGLSVAIIELALGAAAGNLGLKSEPWMQYLAAFGGIVLTFLAGTEIDTRMMRQKLVPSLLIGSFSFLVPFLAAFAFTRFAVHWSLQASLIAGAALSTTSLAVVYSVLVETGLSRTVIGKVLMASTFVTDMGTALALSVLFMKPDLYSLVYVAGSLLVIVLAVRFSRAVFQNPRLAGKVIEPEIKYVFLLLLLFMYFAKLGAGHAVLPAFVLGLLMSGHFNATEDLKGVRNRLRTVAYAIITPAFFIVGGMKISLPLIAAAIGLFAALFFVKIGAKFLGVWFLARKFLPQGSMYTTLLMSTGLTFGTIASVFGMNAGYIDQSQYSILVGVVVASAIIPTVIAQKWFLPKEEEDIVDMK
jgi:Kef-type K+ transport system membrane component KefB